MKRLSLASLLLLLLISPCSNATVNDIANKEYLVSGDIKARITAYCGIVTLHSPMEWLEQFSIKFGELGNTGGTFQITEDNLLPVGVVVDGQITERKINRLTLQYAGISSPLENGEKLKKLIHDKALEHGTDFGTDMTITNYAFRAFVKKDSLRLVETLRMTIPNYPDSGCKARLNVRRKLAGPVVIPAT
jgi:hypothetical protein